MKIKIKNRETRENTSKNIEYPGDSATMITHTGRRIRRNTVECPYCGAELINPENESVCFCCGRKVKIHTDENGKRVSSDRIPDPLYMPRGSIRAAITLMIIFSALTLLLRGKNLPEYLLGLILTITGYYFGMKESTGESADSIPAASKTGPHEARESKWGYTLPILMRILLTAALMLMGLLFFTMKKLSDIKYLEFFYIIMGLVGGYMFSMLFSGSRGTKFYNFINHVKGTAVLSASALLFFLFLSGFYADKVHLSLVLSCLVSFYFGSKI